MVTNHFAAARNAFLAFLILLFLPFSASAEDEAPPAPDTSIPPALKPWVPWVKHDLPELECPLVGATRHCVWPGVLAIDVGRRGASFVFNVWMERAGTVQLPGDKDHWPQTVKVDDQTLVVGRSADGHPEAELGAGAHVVKGRFVWSDVPEVLPVPPAVGNISLSLRGKDVAYPRLRGVQLFLGDAASETSDETESVRASIYRRVEDGAPLTVTTRVQLNVSGRAREVSLGKIMHVGSRPIMIDSPLPTRIQPEGDVTIYVRPGSHLVTIRSVFPNRVEELVAPKPELDFYDPQEVWVWIPNETMRSVELDGLTAVDPERTSLPEDWRGETTFLAEPGASLQLKETRRGAQEAAPNLIRLHRELWLDLDGTGYTVNDSLNGVLNQGWRLEYGAGASLGRVHDRKENADLLITKAPGSELTGVELRASQLDLQAELRLESATSDLRIVGWDHDVQSLTALLQLPPGWTLLGGSGVDRLPGTWFESWTLWDFFFVLMIALSIGRLCGWWWGPISILALCLAHGHEDAPQWVFIHLIATLALLRVLPNSVWRRIVIGYRYVALLTLVVILAPYARDQVRFALHPQVADVGTLYSETTSSGGFGDYEAKGERAMAPGSPMEDAQMGAMDEALEEEPELEQSVSSKSEYDWSRRKMGLKKKAPIQLQQVDPNAVVQTGPGLPTWQWTAWRLEWTGPVRKDHEIQLWLVSPLHNLWLSFLRVALLILIALALIAPRDMYWREPRRHLGAGLLALVVRVGLIGAAMGLMTLVPVDASAESPQMLDEVQNQGMQGNIGNLEIGSPHSDSLLAELRRRLIAEADCPRCVTVSRADIEIDDLRFSMKAEVHVRKLAAWYLPGPVERVSIASIKIDGEESRELRREPEGLTAVRLEPGRHLVELSGVLANQNVVTLQFETDTRPQFVTFKSDEWSVDGISPLGVPDNSLQLTRRVDSEVDSDAQGAELPPWFHVRREFNFGLPWQVRTIVTRGDATLPQLVKVPTIAGEKVITEAVRVEEGRALVDFPRDVGMVEYVSEISIKDEVNFKAAEGEPWTETWTVACSRIWRCAFEGIPPIDRVENGEYRPTFMPWPGESLRVKVEKPEGAPGQASTVDRVSYSVTPGKRLMQAELTLVIRASQGGRQMVTLPPEAELQTVTLDGDEKSIRPTEGKVSLPYRPGKVTYTLKWQQPWERQFIEEIPAVDVGSSAVNVETEVRLGDDRWLLGVKGPAWGPAILFWSHLIILLIIALLLGRLHTLPVKTWEWLLLVIGLSQLPVVGGLPIVLWFVVLTWRRREPQEAWWKFDLVQLGSIGLTFIALGALYAAIHTNLLIDIDMQVEGARSSNSLLRWYVDQVEGALPTPRIISVPILVWRVAMLLWAFWLVSRLIKWARWGWESFSHDGLLWKKPPRKSRPEPGRPGPGRGPGSGPTSEGAKPSSAGPTRQAPDRAENQGSAPEAAPPSSSSASAKAEEAEEARPVEVPSSEEKPRKRKKHSTIPGAPRPTGEKTSKTTGGEEEPVIIPPPADEPESE